MLNTVTKVRSGLRAEKHRSPLVREALVATLFASPISLALGAAVGTLSGAIVALSAADPILNAVAYAIPLVGLLRIYHCVRVRRAASAADPARAELWYELGAWTYAFLIGALACVSVLRVADPQIPLFAACVATGYAAAVCARNAGRPAVAVGQLFVAAVPVSIALIVSGQAVHTAMGIVNLFFVAGMVDVTAKTYSAVSDALSASKAAEDRWLTTLDSLPQMVWSMRPEGGEEFYNRRWDDFTGSSLRFGEQRRIDLVHPEDRQRVLSIWRECVASGRPYEAEYRLLHKSGEYRWVLSRGQAVPDAASQSTHWYGSCIDIHERVLGQQRLNDSEALNRGIIEASPDCVSLLDLEGNVVFANKAALNAYGLDDAAPLVGSRWGSRLLPRDRVACAQALAAAQKGEVGQLTLCLPSQSGELRWFESLVAPVHDAAGQPRRLVVTSRDITHQKAVEDQVRQASLHDHLTGLPNRAFFQQRLDEAMRLASSAQGSFALLLLDLDHFKQTNDSWGHDAGDALLCVVSSRLLESVVPGDFVARLGGDEFAVLLQGVGDAAEATAAGAKIQRRLREPWVYESRTAHCGASIGASIYPEGGTKSSDLLKAADLALYQAKSAGRGQVAVFEPSMRGSSIHRSPLLAEGMELLRSA